jgi:hypothetical protein
MKFILKKDGSGVNDVSLSELAKLLNIPALDKALKDLKLKFSKFTEPQKVDKTFILDEIEGSVMKKGELINLKQAATIEKNKNIKDGTVYYNATKDALRLKTKKGWVSLITE